MRGTGASHRWDLWLTAASAVVAVALVLLAAAANRARAERHTLAIEGRLQGLAHGIEIELRESGPATAGETLAQRLEEEAGLVAGIALIGAQGVEHRVGSEPDGRPWKVDLFLGRIWRMASPSPGLEGHPGQRVLEVAIDPAARVRPLSERLLVPATALGGAGLVALALLGGRLLVRRERAERSAAERRRYESLARAGAGLAHQLRTPIATIKGSCQLLMEECPPERERRLATVLEETERMDRLLGQLLDYARPPHAEPAAVDLGEVTRELDAFDSRVSAAAPPGLAARVDPGHLREILTNLVENALQADGGDSPVEVRAAARGGRRRWTATRTHRWPPGSRRSPTRC